ncbi:hypothetical protein ACHAXR_008667, partial [Thalassiosira sp. AJA248-18]
MTIDHGGHLRAYTNNDPQTKPSNTLSTMRRKQKQDKSIIIDDDNDDDSSANKLHRSPPPSGVASIRSRYEIDHGSCDWNNNISNNNGNHANAAIIETTSDIAASSGTHSPIMSISIDNGYIPPSSSPQPHSPGAEGLHQRKKYDSSSSSSSHNHQSSQSQYPQQMAMMGVADLRHPLAQLQQHPQHASSSSSYAYYRGTNNINNNSSNGNNNNNLNHGNNRGRSYNNNNNIKAGSTTTTTFSAWKRMLQCLFLILVIGYLLFLYLAQYHYEKQQQQLHQQRGGRVGVGDFGHHHHHHPPSTTMTSSLSSRAKAGKQQQSVADWGDAAKRPTSTHGSGSGGKWENEQTKAATAVNGNARRDAQQNQLAPPAADYSNNNSPPIHDYSFQRPRNNQGEPILLQPYHKEEPSSTTPAFQRAYEWSRQPLQNANKAREDRRRGRRQRTKPPSAASGGGGKKTKSSDSMPLWYKLDYSSEDTISSIQQRWMVNDGHDDEKDNASSSAASNADNSNHNIHNGDANDSPPNKYPLCGIHAQAASKHHPANYLPPPFDSSNSKSQPNNNNIHQHHQHHYQPLNSQSRIMISGILTPLGLHLAIALHRQCNVTNFLGLDTQMPNDPLSRLEQQERLAVLMQELVNVKQLIVPYLGLEMKRDKKNGRRGREERRREEGLVELKTGTAAAASSATTQQQQQQHDYARPYQKYGIPLSPGTAHDGSGPLDIVLEYRPTHIVHLAGTQSDSLLLNSNNHHHHPSSGGGGNKNKNNIKYKNAVFQNKGEEEEDILKENLSSRPHLYDLRMGVTGMEQLLSGVVAQTMLSPSYGRENEDGTVQAKSDVGADVGGAGHFLSEGDLIKMKPPHIVYASSYDALHFRDNTAIRRNNQKTTSGNNNNSNNNNDDEVLGSTSPPSQHQKRPPHSLHGTSRLIDEILSASYFALHGISSPIGLRFDAIYGPRGFGVPSSSVPILHVDRTKRRRGVSPDVELAEVAVRGLWRRWMDIVRERAAAAAEEEEEEEESEDGKEKDANNQRRRLGEERQVNLIEEAGWMHLVHDRRDFCLWKTRSVTSLPQYNRAVNNSPTTFNIGSGKMLPLSSLADEIQELARTTATNSKSTTTKNNIAEKMKEDVIDVERSSAAGAASLTSNDYLHWSASTSLKGHLDRALPFFPPASS